ncbi:MAG TPA: ABC transporter permease [Thermoanaerobaculia bacterium]|nr:ABC transporter permease [Thermoanaerobaculia bacterium]
MNPSANAAPTPAVDPVVAAPAAPPSPRPFYWSVRRELWENRSVVLAPLAVAGAALLAFAVRAFGLPERRRAIFLLAPAAQREALQKPYDMLAMVLLATAFLVASFYCLDALNGERRDRSILFWKSLPVSDWTAVLAKASIPLAVLPALTFLLVVATQIVILLSSGAILSVTGPHGTPLLPYPVFRHSIVLLYGLVTLALWHAPFYAWLLLISAWARRAAILWALLPPAVIAAFEKGAFNSSHFASFVGYRLSGGTAAAFAFGPKGSLESLAQLTPGRFLATPGLWLGLAFAAAFLFAAVRLRRARGPI